MMKNVVRKFNISILTTFQELKTFIVTEKIAEPLDRMLCEDFENLKLEYEDEEGDTIMILSQREWDVAIKPWRNGTREDSFRVEISLNKKNPRLTPILPSSSSSPLEELVKRSFHSPTAIQHRILDHLSSSRDLPTSPVRTSPQINSSSGMSPVDIVRRRRRASKLLRRVDEDEQIQKQKQDSKIQKVDNDVVSSWQYLQRGQLLGHGSFGRGMYEI